MFHTLDEERRYATRPGAFWHRTLYLPKDGGYLLPTLQRIRQCLVCSGLFHCEGNDEAACRKYPFHAFGTTLRPSH